ncbi:enoyl-CoA hydratase/isomerase family protein [Hydrogenophaga sp. OTU3427]|uniref:enoyl-CoA hydratase/isomerase family protein n=1 Tax=Hydrogenophaga sp. OTU3427 TaxID=3043856 RepID=UPI00313AD8D0
MTFDPTTYQHIALERREAVLVVTLNRPAALNAIHFELHTELSRLFREIARDRSIRAVVLTGAGRAFCAGGDLKAFVNRSEDQLDDLFDEAKTLIGDILDMPQPLISAINGPAYGLGATLALFADVSYASEHAVIADTHVAAAVVAGDGGVMIWPWLVGAARAKEFLMTGDPIQAQEAHRMGLINHLVPAAELMDHAIAMARRLASGPSQAIQGSKLAVNALLRSSANLAFELSLALEKTCFRSDDHREALAAFAEKRQPNYR